MPAMHQVIRRMPGSHQSGTTVRHARGVIGVRRVWAHECGAEAVEALALVAALIALLALLSLVVRDRAAAIGAAATATLAGWLTGAPGAASVGGTPGITPLTVTAPPHTVVSLPQLLVQTTDAAPWATWGIGIAGGLLSAAAAWRTATGGALQPDAGAWLRLVGAAVDWLIRQGAGLVIGFCEGVVDTIAGLVTLVVDVVKLIAGDEATRRKYGALLEALARDPLGTLAGIFEAIIAPIKTDWQAGRYGEAIGRAVFELLPAILAIVTGGGSAAGYAAKAGNAGKAADALADAGRIVSHVDDVGRIVERVDDAARGVDALADTGRTAGTAAGKAASHADDAAGLAGRIRITPDDVDPLRLRTLEARQRALGTEPRGGRYRPHEGEVGAIIEDWFGGLRRSPDPEADWIGTSGSYEGKTFDLIGLPRGASAFHSDNMENFLPAVDMHFLKSVDYIVLDVRFMTPAQKETVLRHINAQWASEKSRLILVE
jgi:hypothetical protein